MLVERPLAGRDHLAAVTTVLQAARRRSPADGTWEAADLQWWWRRDQHADAGRSVGWFDGDTPVAVAVVTDWGGRAGCDVLSDGSRLWPDVVALAWPRLTAQLAALGDIPVEMAVDDGDDALGAAALAAGFVPSDEVYVPTWMAAADRPAVPDPPSGFRVVGRDEVADRPHHMIARSGPDVAARLAECSLYRPELDLAVLAPDGRVAAYGLFWADLVTGVGMVEPMRTEDAFQQRGLGRLVLAAGLERLAAAGCTRLKVSYLRGNDASRRLYLGAGFVDGRPSRTYVRTATGRS